MSRYKAKPDHYYCGLCGSHTEDGWLTKGTGKFWSRTGAMFSGYDDDGECPDCRRRPSHEKHHSGVFDFTASIEGGE